MLETGALDSICWLLSHLLKTHFNCANTTRLLQCRFQSCILCACMCEFFFLFQLHWSWHSFPSTYVWNAVCKYIKVCQFSLVKCEIIVYSFRLESLNNVVLAIAQTVVLFAGTIAISMENETGNWLLKLASSPFYSTVFIEKFKEIKWITKLRLHQ